jgi:ribosome-associated protein
MKLAGSRLTKEGVIVIVAQSHRDQTRNRADARERLVELIRQAAVKPKARRETKVPRSEKKKRVEGKKHRGQIKAMRGKGGWD